MNEQAMLSHKKYFKDCIAVPGSLGTRFTINGSCWGYLSITSLSITEEPIHWVQAMPTAELEAMQQPRSRVFLTYAQTPQDRERQCGPQCILFGFNHDRKYGDLA